MKILLLGSSGFVGHNIYNYLTSKHKLFVTSRTGSHFTESAIEFDIINHSTWDNLTSIKPDVVINALAYGVIKNETDLEAMYKVNYFEMTNLYEFLREQNSSLQWIQIGTAFEYDLFANAINEDTPCVPLTHYGISKLMFSQFLFGRKATEPFHLLRPFAMFGPYEDDSKIIPALINAQIQKKPLKLSNGDQQRDYIFVENIGILIDKLITNPLKYPKLINLGSGETLNLRQIGEIILELLKEKNCDYWCWGAIPKRFGEAECFYSNSILANEIIGTDFISQEMGIKLTLDYYKN
jgi:nucleoside-diphosphate-sugar epimerase